MASLNLYKRQEKLVSQKKRVPTCLRILYIASFMLLGMFFYIPTITLLEYFKASSTIPLIPSSPICTTSQQHLSLTEPTTAITNKYNLVTMWVNHPFHVDSTKIVINKYADVAELKKLVREEMKPALDQDSLGKVLLLTRSHGRIKPDTLVKDIKLGKKEKLIIYIDNFGIIDIDILKKCIETKNVEALESGKYSSIDNNDGKGVFKLIRTN
ncbi:5980_t:CDS:2 [Entrophospora sp. SA101]|nr:5980_t:CDS:2 [Entrophospora sp. SA101]